MQGTADIPKHELSENVENTSIRIKALPPEETECRGRVVNAPALYSGGPGFKSWPQQPAILIEVVRGF
jgi:hypothetical protein